MQPQHPPGSAPFPTVPTVIFAHWREVLNQSGLREKVRSGYALAIAGYLDYCRRNRLSDYSELNRRERGKQSVFMEDCDR